MLGYSFKIEYLKGTDNKVADVLSRIETQLDDDTVRKLLESCPTTEIKGAEAKPPTFEDQLPEGEDSALRSKVRKEAVNEVIQQSQAPTRPSRRGRQPGGDRETRRD